MLDHAYVKENEGRQANYAIFRFASANVPGTVRRRGF